MAFSILSYFRKKNICSAQTLNQHVLRVRGNFWTHCFYDWTHNPDSAFI